MGKSLIQQKRGKGSHTYRSPSFRYHGSIRLPKESKDIEGKIVKLLGCPGHSTPLIHVKYNNGEDLLMLAPEGVRIGDTLKSGNKTPIKPGNVMPLKNIPEGTLIYNIESQPGDGGKFVRSAGTFAKVTINMKDRVMVLLPSKKEKNFSPDCRASIGMLSAGGRKEKPFLKAGNKYHAMRAKNKLYPHVDGVSMNAVSHPFGGTSSHTKGRPTQAPRNAPPGRKVGKIAPKRTGRK